MVIQSFLSAAGLDNDLFARRIMLSGTNATFTSYHFHATSESGEPEHGTEYGGAVGSLWWSWTAPEDGFLRLDAASAMDVYTGEQIGHLEKVGSFSTSTSPTNMISVRGGTIYQIAACIIGNEPEPIQSGYGPMVHQLRFFRKTGHDNFDDRLRLVGEVVSIPLRNLGATFEPGEPDYGIPELQYGSVWYEWSPPVTGYVARPYTSTTPNSDASLYFFRGTGLGDLRPVAMADRRFPVTAGEKLFISFAPGYLVLAEDGLPLVASSFRIASPTGTVSVPDPRTLEVRIEGIPAWATNLYLAGERIQFSPGASVTEPLGGLAAGIQQIFASVDGHPSFSNLNTSVLKLIVASGTDLFADAPEVDPTRWAIGGAVSDTLMEPWEAPLDSDSPNRSGTIWWRWTPAVDGILRLGGTSAFDETRCDMYRGTGTNDLVAEVVPADGTRVFAGTNYWFRIWRKEKYQGAWASVFFNFQTKVPNDDLVNAEVLTLTGDAREIHRGLAYSEPFEDSGWPSQWFAFTSPGEGTAVIRTDATITIFRLEPSGALTLVANGPGAIPVRSGNSYRIRAYTWSEEAFPRRMTIAAQFSALPPNDSFRDAITLSSSGVGRVEGTIDAATADGLSDPGLQIDRSVWYRFVAPAEGALTVSFDEGGDWPDRIVFASRGAGGQPVTASGQIEAGYQPRYAVANLHAGSEILICLGYSSPSAASNSGRFFLSYSFENAPANDAFENRTMLQGRRASVRGALRNASTEEGEPLSAGSMHRTVWWTWQAPADGMIEVGTTNAIATVYTGNSLQDLHEEPSSDRASVLRFGGRYSVKANTRYHIRVDLGDVSSPERLYLGLFEDYRLDLAFHGLDIEVTPANVQAGFRLSLLSDENPLSYSYWLSDGRLAQWSILNPPGNGSRSLDISNLPPSYYHVFAVVTNRSGDMVATPTKWFRIAPENDMFQNATVLTARSLVLPWTVSGATLESRDQAREGESGSVWFRWTAPAAGSLLISSSGGRSDVFSGENASVLEIRNLETGLIAAVKGRQYWIACYTGTSPDGAAVTNTVSLDLATTSIFSPTRGTQFNTGQSISVRTSTLELSRDVVSTVLRSGTNEIAVLGPPPWTFIWTNAPAGSNNLSVLVRTVAGETYQTAPVSILVRPGNTNSANAVQLAGERGDFTGIASTVQEAIWYRWTAPGNGFLSIQMPGRQSGDSINLWKVDAQGRLTATGPLRDDDETTDDWLVTAGQGYAIEIRRRSSPGGRFQVIWSFHNPPPNDSFSNRIALSGDDGEIIPNLFGSTFETGERAVANKNSSAWWSWTASASGLLEIVGDVMAYRGSTVQSLTYLQPAETRGALKLYEVSAGDILQLAIYGSVSDGEGDPVRWHFISRPSNDDFLASAVLRGERLEIRGSVMAATYEPAGPGGEAPDVWWSWTAPGNGRLVMTSSSYSGGSNIELYRGGGLGSLQPLGAGNIPVSSGETYRFRVVCRPLSDAGGEFDFNFRFTSSPPNDLFADRVGLVGDDVLFSGTTWLADREFGEPIHANVFGGASVWYRWMAPRDGQIILSPENFEASISVAAIYTGDALVSLHQIVSADGSENNVWALSCPVTEGRTYSIAVDGKNGMGLFFDLRLRLVADSTPRLSVITDTGGELRIGVESALAGRWRLERSSDLTSWSEVTILNAPLPSSLPLDATIGTGFFRLVRMD